MANPFVTFFNWVVATWKTADTLGKINMVLTAVTLAVGVKGFMQARQMMAKGQDILANKTSAGGKLPVIYGTRRVGAQIIYMDVSANDSRDLYVVYALSVGECDEILGRTIELDGNPLTDYARFKDGGYIGSDKISSGAYSLNTVSQNGTGIDAGAGGFGSSPTQKYRYVMNLHHGAATQTADPMLVASMPNWTSAHKLNGVCYIAAHYGYDKEGMWKGVPQLTVQVRGKKVFDPRDTNQTFGTVSTYEYSDNPALTFLDYITNNEYGKGLTQSQINMSTFTAAANVCDTQVDQPYFNGSTQSLTWSGNAGDDFITIGGTDPNTNWWQNKIGEVVDINDANGNLIVDGKEIKDVQRNGFYDQNDEYIVYIDDTLGSTYSSQTGSSLVKVKRFHCNGYLDANKNVMDNAKELLANMRGIFLYIDGKYELSIEDTGTSTFSINDNHIIADAGISVDYGNKDKKANKVIVEFFNANKRYELDTATVLHNATPEYYSDDGDEILEIKAEFPYISDPYIAYNMGKAILTRSRNQTTMQFLGTPEMYKLNVGDIVDLTYAGLGFSGKVCRVEALELQSNGLVAVSLIEYFDVYTWEVPPQEPVEELANLPSAYAVKAPTGLSFTDTDSSSTGRPFLSWNEPTDFPNYQYRINVVDSSSNQVLNRIVDVENCDLNFLPVDTNYVASVTSLNTLGTESSPATLTFTIGDAPTATADIKDDAIVTDKIVDDAVTDAKINSLSADKITAGTIDASQITVTNLDADNITSGSIDASVITVTNLDADNITSGTIGADKIDVTNLSAISADLGSITAGDMNIGSGNFTVSSSGFMSATGATISGGITATSLNVTNATVTGTLDASVITLNNEPLDDVLTYSEVGGIGLLTLNEGAAIDGDFVVAGNFEATGSQPDLIVGKVTGIASDTVQADAILRSSTGSGGFRIQAGSGNTQVVGLVYDAVGGTTLSADGGASGTFKINADGALAVTFDSSQNATFTGEVTADALGLPSNTPSTTTNKLYNVGGSLYFNGSAVGGGGAGDITSVAAGTNLNGGGTSGAVTLNLDNTISITGTVTATQFLASGGDSTPSGTTFNNVFKGVSSYRTAYFDGNGSNCSVWWGVGNNPHAALDTTDGNLATWANDSAGTWRKITEHTASGLNITTGGLLVGSNYVIDSSRNLTNIVNLNGSAVSSYWKNSGSWLGDLGSNGYTREYGLSMTGSSEFVILSKNGQGSTLVDGQYISYESANGFFGSYNSSYGNASGIRATAANTVSVMQLDGGTANLAVTGTLSSGAIDSTDGFMTFETSDINGYARFTAANGSAQLGLFRSGSSAGGMYLGSDSAGLEFRNSGFAVRATLSPTGVFNVVNAYQLNGTTIVDPSRNLTNIGTIYSGTSFYLGASNKTRISSDDNGEVGLNYANTSGTATTTLGIYNNTTKTISLNRNGTINSGAINSTGVVSMVTRAEIQGNGGWAYTRLYNSGATMWDIAANPSDNSSALQFRPSGSGTNASLLSTSGNWTINGKVSATEYDLPSGGMLDWANGDARIIEGLVNNYSLSFQTWDGSNVSTALRLDGDNTATFTGNTFLKNTKFLGGNSYNENIRCNAAANDYSSFVLGAVSGDSGTGTGQWTLVRYPSAGHGNKFSIRHSSTDALVFDTSSAATFTSSVTTPYLKVGANFGNYPVSISTAQRYCIGFRNTGATNGATNYPWFVHDSDKLIVHWNAIGDRWSLDQSGNTVNSGNVTAYSDERLKTNIQTLDSKKALQMRGVSFIKDGVEGSGVIAQEIEEIAPELVITADDEMGTKSVAYGNLVGYLIETVKDQQKQIDELKQRLDNDSSN
jgi:hypothetical protein